MIVVTTIPASKQGDFLCEFHQASGVSRCVTADHFEATRMKRAGATIWIGRHGGWIRKD